MKKLRQPLMQRKHDNPPSLMTCLKWACVVKDRQEFQLSKKKFRYENSMINIMYKNPLVYWNEQKSQLPHLANIARKVFITQASSAESERHFSAAGNIVTDLKGRPDPRTVEMLVMLKPGLYC